MKWSPWLSLVRINILEKIVQNKANPLTHFVRHAETQKMHGEWSHNIAFHWMATQKTNISFKKSIGQSKNPYPIPSIPSETGFAKINIPDAVFRAWCNFYLPLLLATILQ